jgi:hypothetical protein
MELLLSLINIDRPVKVPECYRPIVTTTATTVAAATTTTNAFLLAKNQERDS